VKVYTAARFSRIKEIRKYVDDLAKIGVHVTSEWVRETCDPNVNMKDFRAEQHREMAYRDINEVDLADTLILFTNGSETPILRGAHHFEAGYAYGRGKRVITVGDRDNIFYHLPTIRNFATWDEALQFLTAERACEEATLGY
jgi:nucleoside 2-deoxyribosyltransferase